MHAGVAGDVMEPHAVDQEMARGLRYLVVRNSDEGVVVVAWADGAADNRDPRRRCVDVERANRLHPAERDVGATRNRPADDRHVAKLDVARTGEFDLTNLHRPIWHEDDGLAAGRERLRRVFA